MLRSLSSVPPGFQDHGHRGVGPDTTIKVVTPGPVNAAKAGAIVFVLLLFWQQGNPATTLSLSGINLYTILFILLFGIGYGAYYETADMPIPMVADCSDYETYRSGKYIPGIMGTLFSLVDKLVSALGSTIVGFALAMIGISELPDSTTPYAPG